MTSFLQSMSVVLWGDTVSQVPSAQPRRPQGSKQDSTPQHPRPTQPLPNTVHMHPALERPQNPGETCSYFLGGNFDLQEFRLPGQHLPRGVDPDEDRALAFALEGTKKKQQRLGGHSLHSKLPDSSKQAQTCYFFRFWFLFSLYLTGGQPPPTRIPFIASGSEMLSPRVGKHSQRAVPGGRGTWEKKRN